MGDTNIVSPIDQMTTPGTGKVSAQTPTSITSPADTSKMDMQSPGVYDGVRTGPFGAYPRTVGGPPEKCMETLKGGETTTVLGPTTQSNTPNPNSGY